MEDLLMGERVEKDSIGEKKITSSAYYGVQSVRAKENFQITGRRLCPEFIRNLAQIKKAAAFANHEAGPLGYRRMQAIVHACDDVIAGSLDDQFIVDPIQGGAGTSANMNANEVIANRAIEYLGGKKGDYSIVHPNDHVNMAQSTNDVFPTAGKLTAMDLIFPLLEKLDKLNGALSEKAEEMKGIIKIGRTQLQDAVPETLGQTFGSYASMVRRTAGRIKNSEKELCSLNLGGTAIGTGINTTPVYRSRVIPILANLKKLPLTAAADQMDATQNLDCFVAVSGALKSCAVGISKMCSDLRLLSSGPRGGIGELALPAMQNGSSIMPGKVNPVIPEVVTQVCFAVIGNDASITMAAEAGQMELNAFEPVLFDRLFDSIEEMTNAVSTLTSNCIVGIKANRERCLAILQAGTGAAAALDPYIGYCRSAEIAKESMRTSMPFTELALKESGLPAEQLEKILNPNLLAGSVRADSDEKNSAAV
jgi:aspartate ammonia-lyase